jgi:hypothetical protein
MGMIGNAPYQGIIGTGNIQDQAITTQKIANNAVTNSDLAPEAQYTGFKSRIINGAMVIDQRNAGASVTVPASTVYTVDRWQAYGYAASKFSVQQNAGSVTLPVGFSNYLGCTSLSAYTVGAGEIFLLRQFIEGYNIADLGWGTANAKAVTLSFQVYSSLSGTFGGALQNSAQNRSYPFSYTVSSANTWTTVSITIAGDTTGTWNTNNTTGISLVFSLGTGATYSGTAGSWSGNNYFSATGATSVVGTSGATFYITGVQLEKGSTATSFDYRPYGTELALCQRYYEKSFSQGTVPANGGSATALSTAEGSVVGLAQNTMGNGPTVNFKVTKRATPSMTQYGNSSGLWLYALQTDATWAGGAAGQPTRINDSSFVRDQQQINVTTIWVSGHWAASAEL